jgi:prepilin-type N-terminal cleavage/methylation domain-containing protein
MTNVKCLTRSQRGVTLVEMLIVVVLVGIMGAWGSTLLSHNFRTAQIVNSGKASGDQMRFAIDRLTRELRQIKYSNGYSITSTLAPSSTSITFTRTIGGTDVTVVITKSGTNCTASPYPCVLTMSHSNVSSGAAQTLATNVTAFTLDFYTIDSDAGTISATTLASDLRYIVMSLTTSEPNSGLTMTERTRVTMRSS